jgi:hypothetical protein
MCRPERPSDSALTSGDDLAARSPTTTAGGDPHGSRPPSSCVAPRCRAGRGSRPAPRGPGARETATGHSIRWSARPHHGPPEPAPWPCRAGTGGDGA